MTGRTLKAVALLTLVAVTLCSVDVYWDGQSCTDFWSSSLQCSCLFGCYRCSNFYRDYDMGRCIVQCQVTQSAHVDIGPYLCTMFNNEQRTKRRAPRAHQLLHAITRRHTAPQN